VSLAPRLPLLIGLGLALAACSAGSSSPPRALPTDLPPPEYEPGRKLDLAPAQAPPPPSAAPATPSAVPAAPAPTAPPAPKG
jgi:hypothetical protein